MVERNGQEVHIPIAVEFVEKMVKDKQFSGLIKPRMPYVVGSFAEGALAKRQVYKLETVL